MRIHVRPAAGLKVRDPERGGHLPEGGAKVPQTSYWTRRLADRDVEVVHESPVDEGDRPRRARKG